MRLGENKMAFAEVEKLKQQMAESIKKFDGEIVKVHTGRANTALVEGIMVSYYGNKMPLMKVASISIPSSNLIVVQPWDKEALSNIEAGIRESDLGFGITNDGNVVRLSIPPMTEERRGELSKILSRMAEEFKVSLRNSRREVWSDIQEKKRKGEITEDDLYSIEKDLNQIIEEQQKAIEKKLEIKQQEITKI